ncbi:MAG: bacteriohemerythrin [Defluviitaleaceae bacterium]|nr:bacteriohemerythrin [Defluviitaleaceae bacterium]
MLWNKKYETGNQQVDDEHKEIFNLVQKVLNATFESRGEKVGTIIDFLANYTIQHFEHEELLMDESDYPDTRAHKKQHSDFLEEVGKLKKKVEKEMDSAVINITINKTVVGWLTNHVLGSDISMAAHYRKWAEKHNKLDK